VVLIIQVNQLGMSMLFMLLLIKITKVNGKDFNYKAMYVSAWQQQRKNQH